MKRIILLFVLPIPLLAGCIQPPSPTAQPTSVQAALTTPAPSTVPASRTLTVFAAVSLTDAFKEIGKNFEAANPGVTVIFNFAGSQTLRTQLEQGAVADIFASANHSEMDTAIKDNLVASDAPQDFVANALTVILPTGNPANIQSLQDLSKSGTKLVLADKTVPAGKYALQVLDAMSKDPTYGSDFSDEVLANVVSYETDVKLVVAKVKLGEADAGIVYISDSIASPELTTIEIPANFNVVARYPVATLTQAPNPGLAGDFIAYVLSSDGQAVLKKWGFTTIKP
jgi:molybdate transport system substrate-binding protein